MKNRRATDLSTGTRLGLGRRLRGIVALALPAAALAMALVGSAPAEPALAQENSGGSINIGGSIANTVAGAVSGISTGGGSASGGVLVESNEISFGEQEGVAVSDASGGNHNASADSK